MYFLVLDAFIYGEQHTRHTHKNFLRFSASSLSRSTSSSNWQVMDLSDTNSLKKYYINICRPINPVPGCDRHASVCQMKYLLEQVCNSWKRGTEL